MLTMVLFMYYVQTALAGCTLIDIDHKNYLVMVTNDVNISYKHACIKIPNRYIGPTHTVCLYILLGGKARHTPLQP